MASSNKFAQPFKDYEILGRLGSGGMGTVFKAKRRSTGEWVALKVLRPSLSRNDRHVQRLRREASFGLRFDHPNLVKVFGLHEEGGYHYLVMEYVEGKTLRSLLKTWGRFPDDQVIELGIQMASALAHAHGHGVIHRDVKPGNILVDDDGHAMLADLGLAKGEEDTTLTRDGSTVGTPQYMSPEQAQDPRNVGVEGDLYSLGATLYHMSVGQPPFDGESIGQVITKLLHHKAESADALNPEVGAGLNLVLKRLLLKDPELRYRSADELLADLRLIQSGHAPRVDPRLLDRDVILVDRPWYRQPVSLGLVALLILVSILAIFISGERDPTPRTLEELRPRIQELAASGDYKDALRILETAEVEAGEVASKARYREDLLEDFDRRLRLFLEKRGQKEFPSWLQDNGLADWESAYLDSSVAKQIYATWRFTPERLPEPLGRTWRDWRARVQPRMALIVENQAHDRILELESKYNADQAPKVTALVEEHRYREAKNLVKRFLGDPWLALPEAVKRKPVLPLGLSHLLDDFRAERRADNKRIDAMALSNLDTWKRRLNLLVDEVGVATEAQEFEVAQSKLDLLRKGNSPEHRPWKSLPKNLDYRSAELGFVSDIRDLESDLQRTEATKLRADAAEEQERYLIKQDLAHDMLARDLDFEEARRVLQEMRLIHDPAIKLRKDYLLEIRELEGFVSWIYVLLETKSAARRRQDWTIRGTTRNREFLKLDRKLTVMLHFAKEGSEVDKVPFFNLDRYPLVMKIQGELAPEAWKTRRRGMGLYLYFGDEFEKAQIFLGDFDSVQAHREQRRKSWIAEEKGDRENTLRDRLLEVEDHLGKEHLDLARIVLQTIRDRYAGSLALTNSEFRIKDLDTRIRNLERKVGLEARLPITLRKAVSFFPEDPGQDSLGEAKRIRSEIDFRQRETFPKGLQDWTRSPLGLAWAPVSLESPDKDWRRALQFALPIYERSQSFVHGFSIEIPRRSEPPVAIQFTCAGTDLLFVQLPGRPVVIIPDPPGDLNTALKLALKILKHGQKQVGWFLLPGLRYEITVELGAARAGRRSLVVKVDGQRILDHKTKVKERPQTKTMVELRSLGSLVLGRFDVTGLIRR